MRIPAPRLTRALACAAVPAALATALTGCSSSGAVPGPGTGSGSASARRSASPAAPATGGAASASAAASGKYAKLPDPCQALPHDTVTSMVPSVKDASGQPAASNDPTTRGGCSWTGLDGYQYRYLDDSLQRFVAIPNGDSALDQAKSGFQRAVETAAQQSGATTAHVTGLGDEAAVVTWDANKDKTDYHYVTVVARSSNLVVTLDFSGAGLEGASQPKTDQMNADAQQAVRQILTSAS